MDVHLRRGWLWNCTRCGRRQAFEPVPIELSEAERRALSPEELQRIAGNAIFYVPKELQCVHCLKICPVSSCDQ